MKKNILLILACLCFVSVYGGAKGKCRYKSFGVKQAYSPNGLRYYGSLRRRDSCMESDSSKNAVRLVGGFVVVMTAALVVLKTVQSFSE